MLVRVYRCSNTLSTFALALPHIFADMGTNKLQIVQTIYFETLFTLCFFFSSNTACH